MPAPANLDAAALHTAATTEYPPTSVQKLARPRLSNKKSRPVCSHCGIAVSSLTNPLHVVSNVNIAPAFNRTMNHSSFDLWHCRLGHISTARHICYTNNVLQLSFLLSFAMFVILLCNLA